MKRIRVGEIFILFLFMQAALFLGPAISETWAKPAAPTPASTATISSAATAVPPECLQLDKKIRSASRLSACLEAGNAVIGPGAPNDPCKTVYVDDKIPPQLGTIEIQPGGTLYVPDAAIDVKVGAIVVAGTFQAGTQACPIGTLDPGNQVVFRFVGDRPAIVDRNADDCMNSATFQKGIQVADGGTLELYGARGVPRYETNGARKP